MPKKDKVRKGFGFYLLMFLLIIIAFVMVSIVIMLFSPNKNVMGFQFVKGDGAVAVNKTTDSAEIELGIGQTVYSEIVVNTDKTDIVLQNNTDFKHNGIYFSNNVKGFAQTKDVQDFSYTVIVEGTTDADRKLTIDIVESQAFLYFSKDSSVIINIATNENTDIFANTKFTFNTQSGNIDVGGNVNTGYSANITAKNITANTQSGSLGISKHAGSSFDTLNFSSEKGSLDLTNFDKVKVEDLNFSSKNGKFYANEVDGNVNIDTKNATLKIKHVTQNLNVKAVSSIIDVEKVSQNVNFNPSSQIIDQCAVYIDEIGQDFVMPQGKNSEVVLSKIGGGVNVCTTDGNVTIGTKENHLSSKSSIKTQSGNVNLVIGNSGELLQVETDKGDIVVDFPVNITMEKEIKLLSNEGDVKFNFNQDNKIKFVFATEQGEDSTFNQENVHFDIIKGNLKITNPYFYNSTDANRIVDCLIVTKEKIVLDLI